MAGSKRQEKFSKLIKEEISSIFSLSFSSEFNGKLVTITDVVMSPDLGLAKIYISIFPIIHSDSLLGLINDKKSFIRGALGKAIGKEVRVIPELAFFLDGTAERASKIDSLLEGLHIPPAESNDEE
jgi:ribosome-binding factor A